MKKYKNLQWILGAVCIAGVLIFISIYPVRSLLEWQSSFLSHCFFVLMGCFAFCFFRIIRGPTPADRAAAMCTMGILVVGFCATLSIPTGRSWYLDVAIAWALQSFIGALALAKYLEGRGFDE